MKTNAHRNMPGFLARIQVLKDVVGKLPNGKVPNVAAKPSSSKTKHDQATCPACGKNTIRSLVLPDLRMKFGQQRNDTLPMFKIGILAGQRVQPARNNNLSVPV